MLIQPSLMKNLFILLAGFIVSEGYSQVAAPVRRPLVLWADANDQDYYGYNNYYYGGYYAGGGYYGYGGAAGRGRDWNNYSDGRYEERGNHRGADRAAGVGRGGGRR
ncbi:MAG: hypothetical protein EBT57_03410 [Verrucomicrobia bacterium]|nr:hypothetical protein [Verrucomicrobiota bacterium]